MRTSKQAKNEQYRKKYGEDTILWYFEWKGGLGTIGAVPAPDLKTAFLRLILQLKRMRHEAVYTTLWKAKKHRMLSRIITVTRIPLEKPTYFSPINPPN